MPIVARPRAQETAALVVAKYRRVSTPDQLDGFGLEEQDRICNEWLSRHPGTTLYDDYVDGAASGALESRPDMDRLVADGKGQNFNRILVPKVDRIGRTARAAYQWAWNMADIGIHFISVAEGIDTSTENGWQQFMQYVTFSETEWRRIKERTVAGRELKISYGGWPGGPAPYGYRIAENSPLVAERRRKKFTVLVTDSHEAMVLSVAVALLVDDGLNISETAEELNRRKHYTRSGVPWSAANLRARLRHESIQHGYVLYRKANRGNGKNTTLRHEDGSPVHGETLKIAVPRIFDEARANTLVERLKEVGFRNARKADRPYPLSNHIKGRCGQDYVGGGTAERRAYRCNGLTVKGASCGEPSFGADEIEEAVWTPLSGLLKDERRLRDMAGERVRTLPGDRAKYEARVHAYTEQIAQQETLLQQRVPEYVRAGVSPQVLDAAVRSLEGEKQRLAKERAIAQQWLDQHAEQEDRVRRLVGIVSNAPEHLDTMTPEERADIFAMLKLEIHPGPVENTAKPGVRCEVTDWHHETGMLVPPDPTDEEWETVLEVLRGYFHGRRRKHFAGKYDIREQYRGMLHRLRHGLSWVGMPLTFGPVNAIRERQLTWWKEGAWKDVMTALGADKRGVPAYRRPTLPTLRIVAQLGVGLLVEVNTGNALDKPKSEAELSSSHHVSSLPCHIRAESSRST
ncbi:recombinase family protein [Streptomyces fragilis]|uniref:Recombinase family protein n=1 Tax=Streptomyces fragilis TaxID=67301 RepID=A0ABV2YFT3_9ACTN|nr:recombinase family protein [Streptomyces fragilis]